MSVGYVWSKVKGKRLTKGLKNWGQGQIALLDALTAFVGQGPMAVIRWDGIKNLSKEAVRFATNRATVNSTKFAVAAQNAPYTAINWLMKDANKTLRLIRTIHGMIEEAVSRVCGSSTHLLKRFVSLYSFSETEHFMLGIYEMATARSLKAKLFTIDGDALANGSDNIVRNVVVELVDNELPIITELELVTKDDAYTQLSTVELHTGNRVIFKENPLLFLIFLLLIMCDYWAGGVKQFGHQALYNAVVYIASKYSAEYLSQISNDVAATAAVAAEAVFALGLGSEFADVAALVTKILNTFYGFYSPLGLGWLGDVMDAIDDDAISPAAFATGLPDIIAKNLYVGYADCAYQASYLDAVEHPHWTAVEDQLDGIIKSRGIEYLAQVCAALQSPYPTSEDSPPTVAYEPNSAEFNAQVQEVFNNRTTTSVLSSVCGEFKTFIDIVAWLLKKGYVLRRKLTKSNTDNFEIQLRQEERYVLDLISIGFSGYVEVFKNCVLHSSKLSDRPYIKGVDFVVVFPELPHKQCTVIKYLDPPLNYQGNMMPMLRRMCSFITLSGAEKDGTVSFVIGKMPAVDPNAPSAITTPHIEAYYSGPNDPRGALPAQDITPMESLEPQLVDVVPRLEEILNEVMTGAIGGDIVNPQELRQLIWAKVEPVLTAATPLIDRHLNTWKKEGEFAAAVLKEAIPARKKPAGDAGASSAINNKVTYNQNESTDNSFAMGDMVTVEELMPVLEAAKKAPDEAFDAPVYSPSRKAALEKLLGCKLMLPSTFETTVLRRFGISLPGEDGANLISFAPVSLGRTEDGKQQFWGRDVCWIGEVESIIVRDNPKECKYTKYRAGAVELEATLLSEPCIPVAFFVDLMTGILSPEQLTWLQTGRIWQRAANPVRITAAQLVALKAEVERRKRNGTLLHDALQHGFRSVFKREMVVEPVDPDDVPEETEPLLITERTAWPLFTAAVTAAGGMSAVLSRKVHNKPNEINWTIFDTQFNNALVRWKSNHDNNTHFDRWIGDANSTARSNGYRMWTKKIFFNKNTRSAKSMEEAWLSISSITPRFRPIFSREDFEEWYC